MKNTDNTINPSLDNEFASVHEEGFLNSTEEEKQKTALDLRHEELQYNFDDLMNVPTIRQIQPVGWGKEAGNQLTFNIKVSALADKFDNGNKSFPFKVSKLNTATQYGATHKIENGPLSPVDDFSIEQRDGTKVILTEVAGTLKAFNFEITFQQITKYARRKANGDVRIYLIAVQSGQSIRIYWAGE